MNKATVVHVTTSIVGGAGRSAHRLHLGLQSIGVDSCMYIRQPDIRDPHVKIYSPARDIVGRIRTFIRDRHQSLSQYMNLPARNRSRGPFSDDRSPHGSLPNRQLPESFVTNLHWVTGFIDYRSFFQTINPGAYVVWTLHDMNAFTGGCHYSHNCDRYTANCGTCPHLGSRRQRDLSRRIWNRKRKALSGLPHDHLAVVAPSKWLASEARRSSLFANRLVRVIPYGVDTAAFKPRDKETAKKSLGLPPRSLLVLFVAANISDPRKGFETLRQCLREAPPDRNILLVSVGRQEAGTEKGPKHVHLGQVGEQRLLCAVYNAADVTVLPSVQDNLPNTAIESIACGTPVVGTNVGGIPDIVRPGLTGLLVPPKHERELREAIEEILGNAPKRRRFSEGCRTIALNEYSLGIQAQRYKELYESMYLGTPSLT